MNGDDDLTLRLSKTMMRPRVPPGPLHALKALLWRLYVQAGKPSAETIARWIGDDKQLKHKPRKDTVHRYITEPRVPPNLAPAVEIAVTLAHAARLDPNYVAGQVRDLWTQESLHPTEPLRKISQWEVLDLEVHRAIRVGDSGRDLPAVGDEELTGYVEREHDRVLRRRLDAAKGGAAALAVLVGGSCTGKTRAMYEAVAACLPDWPLLAPRSADELRRWVEADAIDAETVLWLNETQRYLPAAAEQLAVLLGRVRPLAVVASNWPVPWNPLAVSPDPAGPDDAVVHIRALVDRYQPEISVTDGFDGNELDNLRRLAPRDPRISAALTAAEGDGRVIQHLTGGPELVAHYEDSVRNFFASVERAVITAALDARRLGHASPIPAALLADAAAGYLPGRQRVSDDPQWIDTVLHALSDEKKGKYVKGALTALIPDRPGQPSSIGPAEGYHPANYLDQHARHTRRFDVPHAGFWDAAAQHARVPDDLARLGHIAERRWRKRHAAQLYRRAADAGNTFARGQLAQLRRAADRDDEQLAEATAGLRKAFGFQWWAKTREWASGEQLRQDFDAGDTTALCVLAWRHERFGDEDGAEKLYGQAADAGDTTALCALAWRCQKAGKDAFAKDFALRAADAGQPFPLLTLAAVQYTDPWWRQLLRYGLEPDGRPSDPW